MARTGWFLLAAAGFLPAAGSEVAPAEALTFEQHVRPIFRAHCFDCHGAAEEMQGNLDLRLVRFMVKGGESGPALAPGDPDGSYLLDRIRGGEMPPGDAVMPAAERAVIERWIAQGAKTARPEPESLPPGLGITPEERAFWAFRPVRRPAVPVYSAADPVRTPIDAFLLARLRDAGLTFSPEADRATLIRRASFDLLGLPPAPEEVERFVADNSPDAYERMVDRLLASPRYGERWARHWLDVAGYADSDGVTAEDPVRPYAYKYRDYVVRAFNSDKPLDRFITEQLAGDELVPPPHTNLGPEQIELLAATGFLRTAADGTAGGVDQDAARNQTIADTIKIVSTSLLGLSVGCAQCHDHRYDPIPQTDYYRLRAVFEPALDWKNWRTPPQRLVSLYTDADRASAAEIEAEAQKVAAEKGTKQAEHLAAALEMELQKHPAELRDALRTAYNTPADKRTPEQQQLLKERPSVNINPGVLYQYDPKAAEDLKSYDARIAEIRARKPREDFVPALTELGGPPPATLLFHRGDHRQPKGQVGPGDLTVFAPENELAEIADDDPSLATTGRRLAYARWLTSGRHPLVARVLVNRVWMHHFGRGIVGTPADFGRLGERPTHPELLDWLASELIAEFGLRNADSKPSNPQSEFRNPQSWSLKRLHRTILLSAAYRQSSQRDAAQDAADADGRLLSRMPLRRLDAEAIRDRMLAAGGALDGRMYGPPVPVKADDAGQIVVDGDDARRSLYLQHRRTQPVAVLTAFDAPVMQVNCESRPSSTVATQSLMLMNSEFILRQSRRLAERARREAAADPPPAALADLGELPLPAPAWQYGYGGVDEGTGRTAAFHPLPHWTGSMWQGGPELPDPAVGWVLLHGPGGHAGNDARHAAIRRWTVPRDGFVNISGTLKHASPNGDGVRGQILSVRTGRVGEWTAFNGESPTAVERLEVRRGDTVDFVVDCRENPNADSFEWAAQVTLQDAAGASLGSWNSQTDFRGPAGPPLPQQVARAWKLAYGRDATADELRLALESLGRQIEQMRLSPVAGVEPESQAMTNLAQALLTSNEFLYID